MGERQPNELGTLKGTCETTVLTEKISHKGATPQVTKKKPKAR